MLNKEHNTIEGLRKIVSYRASLNLGLSLKLKEAFPDITPIPCGPQATPGGFALNGPSPVVDVSNSLTKAKQYMLTPD